MFDTLKSMVSLVKNELSKSYDSLDDRIDHFLKLTSISVITVISIPFVVLFDVGFELGQQYIACRSADSTPSSDSSSDLIAHTELTDPNLKRQPTPYEPHCVPLK
jgi:hypothetical protein